MQAEFWQQRWESNQIGFHQEAVNPCLQRHWPDLGLAADSRVLVPLCGKSLDLSWLAAQGMRVLGVELTQKAVEDFFTEHRLEPQIRQHGVFQVYEAGPVELWCGDIFALSAADVADCRGLYDRAALIALPPPMRERYAAHLNRIMVPGSRGLLITLDYDQAQLDGPPFSVPDQDVQALFAQSWQLHGVEVRDVLGENAKFVKAGASRLEERVYRLNKR